MGQIETSAKVKHAIRKDGSRKALASSKSTVLGGIDLEEDGDKPVAEQARWGCQPSTPRAPPSPSLRAHTVTAHRPSPRKDRHRAHTVTDLT